MAKDPFIACIRDNLQEAKGFGPKRTQRAIEDFIRERKRMTDGGMSHRDAGLAAQQIITDRIEANIAQTKRQAMATAKVITGFNDAMEESLTISMPWLRGSPGDRIGVALRTQFEEEVRMTTSNKSFQLIQEEARVMLGSFFRDHVDNMGKNWLGIQRGALDQTELADEIIRLGSTKNQIAHDIADAYKQGDAYAQSEMNRAGTAIPLRDGELPYHPVAAKMVPEDQFVAEHINAVDWNRSGGGRYILPEEREQWLKDFRSSALDGNWKRMPTNAEFMGGQFARDFNSDRLIQFKDGQTYMTFHNKYMDGDIFQTIMQRNEKLSYNIARAQKFGPSPKHTWDVMKQMAQEKASELTRAQGKGNPKRVNKFIERANVMADLAFKANSMDPESTLGQAVSVTGNVMSASMLGSSIFLSIPSDFATTLSNQLVNHEPWMRLPLSFLDAFARIRTSRQFMLDMGHSLSEMGAMIHDASRFGWGGEIGGRAVKASKRVSDITMRASFVTRGFDAMRAADLKVRTANIFEHANTKFDELPFVDMLKRNGITEAEWNTTRNAMKQQGGFKPAEGVEVFRPSDHRGAMGDELTSKWRRLLMAESKRSVFEASLETRAMMLAGLRQDQLSGAMLSSWAKFKSYPHTFFLAMVRQFLALDTPMARAAYIGRLGLFTIMAGALGIQVKNLWAGKQAEDMRTATFWLRAMAAGGTLGLWGDFLTSAMRSGSAMDITKQLGGPYAEFVGDTLGLTMGSAFQWAEIGEAHQKWSGTKAGIDLLDYMRRYLIPQPFYVAPILQRNVLEPFQEWIDPNRMQRRYKAQKAHAVGAGAGYRKGYGPGSRAPFPFTGG